MMIFVNEVYKVGKCPREYAEGLVKMFSCVCPHAGEEIWQRMGHDNTIAYEPWPTYDEAKTVEDTVEMVRQRAQSPLQRQTQRMKYLPKQKKLLPTNSLET